MVETEKQVACLLTVGHTPVWCPLGVVLKSLLHADGSDCGELWGIPHFKVIGMESSGGVKKGWWWCHLWRWQREWWKLLLVGLLPLSWWYGSSCCWAQLSQFCVQEALNPVEHLYGSPCSWLFHEEAFNPHLVRYLGEVHKVCNDFLLVLKCVFCHLINVYELTYNNGGWQQRSPQMMANIDHLSIYSSCWWWELLMSVHIAVAYWGLSEWEGWLWLVCSDECG